MQDPNWYGFPVDSGKLTYSKSSFGWWFSHPKILHPVKVHAYKDQVVYPDYSNNHYGCYCQLTCGITQN